MQKNYLIDMDGVLVKGKILIPGADEFIDRLKATNTKFLILTNNPIYTPRDLEHRLKMTGLNVPAENIFTSAMMISLIPSYHRSSKPNHSMIELGCSQTEHSA